MYGVSSPALWHDYVGWPPCTQCTHPSGFRNRSSVSLTTCEQSLVSRLDSPAYQDAGRWEANRKGATRGVTSSWCILAIPRRLPCIIVDWLDLGNPDAWERGVPPCHCTRGKGVQAKSLLDDRSASEEHWDEPTWPEASWVVGVCVVSSAT